MPKTLANNPAFTLQHEDGPYRIYTPDNIAEGYSMERFVLASHQQQYSDSGITRERLEAVIDAVIAKCNDKGSNDTIRTDVGTLMNGLKYCLQYPVDEYCAIRTGAILSFIEYTDAAGHVVTEDPDNYDAYFTQLKERLARERPGLFAFFLGWGVSNTPKYREHFDTLTATNYFQSRREALSTFFPSKDESETVSTTTP